tara:strand:+ start:1299 stop:1850 length:552 start_codon:yes stop_codon:yes gene_type:complete
MTALSNGTGDHDLRGAFTSQLLRSGNREYLLAKWGAPKPKQPVARSQKGRLPSGCRLALEALAAPCGLERQQAHSLSLSPSRGNASSGESPRLPYLPRRPEAADLRWFTPFNRQLPLSWWAIDANRRACIVGSAPVRSGELTPEEVHKQRAACPFDEALAAKEERRLHAAAAVAAGGGARDEL